MWTSCDPSEVYVALAEMLDGQPEWHRDAACREHPGVDFFPERGQPSEPAKAVCRGCLVRTECLAFALADPDLLGVWGATSAVQRKAMRKATQAA